MYRFVNFNKKKKAFTLIELLVVVAIIGILSGIIIVSMTGTQESAIDARIKATMAQLRSSIEVYELINGADYTGLESDADISLLVEDIEAQNIIPTININGTGDAYCFSVGTKSNDDKWCIDSDGFTGIGDCSDYSCIYTSGVDLPVSLSCGSAFTDERDDSIYTTVSIGDQCWMAENLAYLPSVVGPDKNSNTVPYYYVYGYNETDISDAKETSNYSTYGVLYNWAAIDAINVCPSGWHLPTDDEWKTLEMYLGMSQAEADKSGYRGTDEGGKLSTYTLNGTNSSGFSALMSGYRPTYGMFGYIGSLTYFWSSSADSTLTAWSRYLYTSYSTVYRYTYDKAYGFSVRCVKD